VVVSALTSSRQERNKYGFMMREFYQRFEGVNE
jgi:hypothetical protein